MLPLLRLGLILLAFAPPAKALPDTASSSQTGWFFDVGAGSEFVHWHETSAEPYYIRFMNNSGVIDTGSVGTGPDKRFVTEEGLRWRFGVGLSYRFDPDLSIESRFSTTLGAIGYDGGIQGSRELVPVEPTQYYHYVAGTYDTSFLVYRQKTTDYTSSTGYQGWQFDLRERGRMGVTRSLFVEELVGVSSRSLLRKVDYTTSRSHGYNETWDLTWFELGGGPGWRNREWLVGSSFVALIPSSSEETIDWLGGSSSSLKVKPKANMGVRIGLRVEHVAGARMELSYESRSFKLSDPVSIGSGIVIMQPASVEKLGRLDLGWCF